jgi:hypothetical protein
MLTTSLIGTWYGHRCILTAAKYAEACHVIPDCVDKRRNPLAFATFWEAVGFFWSEDEVENVMELLSTPYGIKRNLLSLSRDTHLTWSQHNFVLAPQDKSCDYDDDDELTLEFRWIRSGNTIEGVRHSKSIKSNAIIRFESETMVGPFLIYRI